MSNYIATVIKTGNSLALRVPKQYATDAGLNPGDKVGIKLAQKQRTQDRKKIQKIIIRLQENRTYSSIADPVKWQHEIRKDRPIIKKR